MTLPAQTTQSHYPWRATVRTAFAVVVALAAMLPALVNAAGLDQTAPGDRWRPRDRRSYHPRHGTPRRRDILLEVRSLAGRREAADRDREVSSRGSNGFDGETS